MLIEITYNVTDVYMSTTETPVYVEISFEQPGSASAVWGSITGTLSDQTDLQNALNAKVPYSGATGNVDLGEYELKAGQVEFDQTPTGAAGVGVMRWNDADGTVDLGLKGGNVTLQVGQEQVARVVNKTGANLLESEYKVVKVSSAQGQRLAVDLAQANNDNNSADTLGIVTENISNNQEGFITTMGTIRGIDTTGSLQGETWTDGDVLYLSGTTAGAITNVKPTAPLHIVVVGYVEYAHQNNGKIFVKVMNGWELDELHNVLISSPTDNQGLFYNATSTLWENKSITTALGYTPVPTTRNITINGVTYDLSADRTWTVAGGISGSGASGQVTYWTGASAVSGSNNLFWDNTNSRLGIGTNAPSSSLTINGITTSNSFFANNSTANITLANGTVDAQQVTLRVSGTDGFLEVTRNSGTSPNLIFRTNGVERMRLFAGGNFSIGTISDLGVRLGVVGDTLLRGSGNSNTTTALTVQNSSSNTLLIMRNDGVLELGGVNSGPFLYPITTSNSSVLTGTNFGFYSLTTTQATDVGTYSFNGANLAQTSGNVRNVHIYRNFQPTSGSATYSGLSIFDSINQTGGANGITRGLYVNPTLTAAADFRAIETTAGNVLFGSNFFWDNTNGRLGIGTNAPSNALTVHANAGDDGITLKSNTGLTIFQVKRDGTSTNTAELFQYAGGNIRLAIRSTANLSYFNGGNFVFGGTSDLGVRLGVVGDTLLRGSGNSSVTTALTVQNSSSTNLLTVRNDSRVGISTNAPGAALDIWNSTENAQVRISDSRISIPSYSGTGFSPVLTVNTAGFFGLSSSTTGGVQFSGFTTGNNSAFPFVFVGHHGGTSPTNPALTFWGFKHDGANNRTALTGSEIIAGFRTGSNADVFQVKANGRINMSSLPTSTTGLVAGDLWNNGGVINIV